ncbi:MAG: HK97-gp10 family putative phage morphogenesis protein [Oscillospiraceae bacterium]
MAHHDIKFEGLVELKKGLRERVTLDAVKRVVQKNGDQMNARMKKNTESAFVKGYSTGDTASSINTTLTDSGLTAEVGPTTDYAYYVEFGTRKMEAEPFVKPAWEEQKEQFEKDMQKLVK